MFGFVVTMAFLLAGAEILLPGWWRMFFTAMHDYHRYTQNQSVLDQLVPWMGAGKILALLALVFSISPLWAFRHGDVDDPHFGSALALTTALTVLVVPMYAPYNQVLLLPAVLLLVRERRCFMKKSGRGMRFVFLSAVLSLSWQWIASLSLAAIYLLISPSEALKGWKWPFFATFALPVLVFLLVLMAVRNKGVSAEALRN
jgi:hypothetical protein